LYNEAYLKQVLDYVLVAIPQTLLPLGGQCAAALTHSSKQLRSVWLVAATHRSRCLMQLYSRSSKEVD